MDYTIGFMDEQEAYSDFRKFYNIRITKTTVIDTVAEISNETILNIDEDADGKTDMRYQAAENSRGELVEDTYWIYIAAGSAIVFLGFLY